MRWPLEQLSSMAYPTTKIRRVAARDACCARTASTEKIMTRIASVTAHPVSVPLKQCSGRRTRN